MILFRFHLPCHRVAIFSSLLPTNLPDAQAIREHALHVLRILAELMPNELLNAHKTAVLVALAAAIEDRKRCVRRAAVRCRNTWYACVCVCVNVCMCMCVCVHGVLIDLCANADGFACLW